MRDLVVDPGLPPLWWAGTLLLGANRGSVRSRPKTRMAGIAHLVRAVPLSFVDANRCGTRALRPRLITFARRLQGQEARDSSRFATEQATFGDLYGIARLGRPAFARWLAGIAPCRGRELAALANEDKPAWASIALAAASSSAGATWA